MRSFVRLGQWSVLALALCITSTALAASSNDGKALNGGPVRLVPVPNVPVITGPSITNDSTPNITGTCDPSVTIEIFEGVTSLGTAVATVGGTFSVTVSSLSDGTHSLTATAMDGTGTSAASSAFSVIVDTAAPSAPTISGPANTNDTTPDMTGTAEASATVQILEGGSVIGSGTASGGGSFTVTVSTLSVGAHSLVARAIDAAGNVSASSSAFTCTVDTTAPSAPSISSPAITNDTTPNVTGTAEASSTVEILESGSVIASGTATGGGSFTITLSTMSEGVHSLVARATDAASNVSANSSAFSMTVDATAPSAPSITGPADTNDTTPNVVGTAEANSTVEVLESGSVIGSATASAGGTFTVTVSTLSVGAHSLVARATDAATNVSSNSSAFTCTVDTTAPSAPSITGPAVSNDTTPAVVGTAEANSTVEILESGSVIGTGTATGGGTFSVTVSVLAETAHSLVARATDAASNVSANSSAFSCTIDVTAPSAPSITAPSVTNDTTPTITGTAEASSTVEILESGSVIGSGTATGGGTFSITVSVLTEATHSLVARATDSASNVSSNSATFSCIVDVTAPAAPTITGPALTNDATPDIVGTAEANATVQILEGGSVIGSGTADGSGNFTVTVSTLTEATHSLVARATDAAANVGSNSSAFSVTVDLTSPTTPTITSTNVTNDTTPTVTGTAEASTTIQILDSGTVVGSGSVSGGAFSITCSTLTEGAHSIVARSTDTATNHTDSATFTLTIDVTAPTAPVIVTPAFTNSTTPTVTGTAEASATVTIVEGLTTLGTGSADGSGNFSIAVTTLSVAAHSISARATDAAGNVGPNSSTFTLTVDQTAPAAPTISSPANTNDTTPSVSGTAEAYATVDVLESGSTIGTGTADASGNFAVTVSALTEAAHSLVARATDRAGNVGSNSAAFIVTVDITAPGAPTVTGPTLTNDSTPDVTGTAEANSTVEVLDGGSLVGSGTADGSGNFTITVSSLADGVHAITAHAIDGVGNQGVDSSSFSMTVDTTPPAAPTNLAGASPVVANPAFSWTASSGAATYNVYRDGSLLGNTASTSYTDSASLADATYVYTVSAIDAATNEGSQSSGLSIQVSSTWPTNVALVGPTGQYADVAAAFAGNASANLVILMQAGTYPAFTVGRTVRIMPDGSGPVLIDTSSASVIINSATASDSIELVGLTIGSLTASHIAVQVASTPAAVVLDGCTLSENPVLPWAALDIASSRHVSVNNCTITQGMYAYGWSFVIAQNGSVDHVIADNASLVRCTGVTVGNTSLYDANSIVAQLQGIAPTVTIPRFVSLAGTAQLDFHGVASSPWALFASTVQGLSWTADPISGVEGVQYMTDANTYPLYTSTTDVNGDESMQIGFGNDPYFLGYTFVLQAVGYDATQSVFRLTNVVSVVGIP